MATPGTASRPARNPERSCVAVHGERPENGTYPMDPKLVFRRGGPLEVRHLACGEFLVTGPGVWIRTATEQEARTLLACYEAFARGEEKPS